MYYPIRVSVLKLSRFILFVNKWLWLDSGKGKMYLAFKLNVYIHWEITKLMLLEILM